MHKTLRAVTLAALITLGIGAVTDAVAGGPVYVRPHYRSNGSYVPGHYRSAPNGTTLDNWSTYPNVNPYTGKPGTRDPYPSTIVPFSGAWPFGGYGGSSGLRDPQPCPYPYTYMYCAQ
jgi:hypothetical protein